MRGPHSGAAIRAEDIDGALFWAQVDKGGDCWLWTGSTAHGYGQAWLPSIRKQRRAHRASYALAYGECPSSLVVMHLCDVKACVNPAHLAVGTQRENSLDAQRKGLSAAPKIFCDKCGRQRKKFARGLACERCRSEIGKAAWRERRPRLIAGRIEARKRSSPQRPKLVYSALVQLVGERNAEMYARNYALYQFSDAVPMHLSELGELYGVSRERCRQIISRTGEIAGGTGRTFWAPLRGK